MRRSSTSYQLGGGYRCVLSPRRSNVSYTVMFQAALVQNAAWNSVDKTCAASREQLYPEYMASLGDGYLEKPVRLCGFYKGKAWTRM